MFTHLFVCLLGTRVLERKEVRESFLSSQERRRSASDTTTSQSYPTGKTDHGLRKLRISLQKGEVRKCDLLIGQSARLLCLHYLNFLFMLE